MVKYHLLLSLSILLSFATFAQKGESDVIIQKDANGDFYYEQIVSIEGHSKDMIFERSRNWVTTALKTGDNNINADQNELTITNSSATKIDAKTFAWFVVENGNYEYKLRIWAKDNKYKVRIDNIMINLLLNKGKKEFKTYSYGELDDGKLGKYVKAQINEKTNAILIMLKTAIVEGDKHQNDW